MLPISTVRADPRPGPPATPPQVAGITPEKIQESTHAGMAGMVVQMVPRVEGGGVQGPYGSGARGSLAGEPGVGRSDTTAAGTNPMAPGTRWASDVGTPEKILAVSPTGA